MTSDWYLSKIREIPVTTKGKSIASSPDIIVTTMDIKPILGSKRVYRFKRQQYNRFISLGSECLQIANIKLCMTVK